MSKFQVGDEVEVVSVDKVDVIRGLKKGKNLIVGNPINKNIVYFKGKNYGLYPGQLKLVESKQDNINPSHYTQGKYETIDIILDRVENLPGNQSTLVGNIIKYLWRYDKKNGVEDLNKSKWYLDKLIEVVEDEPSNK